MDPTHTTKVCLAGGREIIIPSHLLKQHSGFFAGRLRYLQDPKANREVSEFPEITHEIFSYFHEWLLVMQNQTFSAITNLGTQVRNSYIKGALTEKWATNRESLFQAEVPATAIDGLVDAWILGDYLLAPAFQNWIMYHLRQCYEHVHESIQGMPVYNMQHIFSNTSENSKLRKFIVKAVAANITTPICRLARFLEPSLMPHELRDAISAMNDFLNVGKLPWAGDMDLRQWNVEEIDWEKEFAARTRR